MGIRIEHLPDQQRFFALVEGHECRIDYQLEGARMTITHTFVPKAVGGRGIAGKLMQFALATAREQGWEVIPECSYARYYIERHPDELG